MSRDPDGMTPEDTAAAIERAKKFGLAHIRVMPDGAVLADRDGEPGVTGPSGLTYGE